MRSLFGGRLIALLLGAFFMSSVSAQPFSQIVSPNDGAALVRVQYGYGYGFGYDYRGCDELRRACEYKDRLGEWGRGNCRRYHEQCDGRGPAYCAGLRRACLYQYEYGEVRHGVCARYRHECIGSPY